MEERRHIMTLYSYWSLFHQKDHLIFQIFYSRAKKVLASSYENQMKSVFTRITHPTKKHWHWVTKTNVLSSLENIALLTLNQWKRADRRLFVFMITRGRPGWAWLEAVLRLTSGAENTFYDVVKLRS